MFKVEYEAHVTAVLCTKVATLDQSCVLSLQAELQPELQLSPPKPTVFTFAQKQARVNRLLTKFVKGEIGMPRATEMLQEYERENRVWNVTTEEFRGFVADFHKTQSYLITGQLFWLSRKAEFQSLMKAYV